MPSKSCRRRTKDSCLRHSDHCSYTSGQNRHCRRKLNITYKKAITKKLLTLYKKHNKTLQRRRHSGYSTPTSIRRSKHRVRHNVSQQEAKPFWFF